MSLLLHITLYLHEKMEEKVHHHPNATLYVDAHNEKNKEQVGYNHKPRNP